MRVEKTPDIIQAMFLTEQGGKLRPRKVNDQQ